MLLKLFTCNGNNFYVKVTVDERTYHVRAKLSDQVIAIRRKVEKMLGKFLNEYSLHDYQLRSLKCETKLSEISYQSGIYFIKSKQELYPIKVILPSNNTVKLLVSETNLIEHIKNGIHYLEGIPVRDQRIHFEGCIVHDSNTLLQCDIKAESTLELYIVQKGCYLECFFTLIVDNMNIYLSEFLN